MTTVVDDVAGEIYRQPREAHLSCKASLAGLADRIPPKGTQTGMQTDRQTDRQTDGQTDGQTDPIRQGQQCRQADGQTGLS